MVPLSKLGSTMELERNAIPEEELNEGHREVANLFEQTVLLTAQTYNSLPYQHRMNVLSTLMPNSTKVKEILKDQSLELDGIKNKYLFGENFKEKLSKITTAKQKSKTIFTGLQKSLSSTSKIYHKSYSYQITPKGGNTAPKNIFSNSSIHKNFDDIRELGKSPSCLPSKIFSGKLEETDKRFFHFEGSSRISNTPIIRNHSIFFPFRSSNNTGGTDSCRSGHRKNVGKTGNKISATLKRPVSENLFHIHQKRRRISLSSQFEKVESVHPVRTLQNGRSISFEENSPEERLYVQDRLKGRFFCSFPSFKLPEIYQVQMERESLSVFYAFSLASVRLQRYSQN